MNVQDALGISSARLEENTQTVHMLGEIKDFANEAEATLAEHLGAGNESVGQLGSVSAQAEAAQSAAVALAVEIESLIETLSAIQ